MVITPANDYLNLRNWIQDKKRIMLVCGQSFSYHEILYKTIVNSGRQICTFSEFSANPTYESVVKGVKQFREFECDSMIAVGGGSTIDVGKCIKLFSRYPGDGIDGSWLKQTALFGHDEVPFLAIPTTAGSGSEATKYAVVYYRGIKQSISSNSIIPDCVLLDASLLNTLSVYQRKATLCDALCHGIESYLSINSTEESEALSARAISGVLMNIDGYLSNTDNGNEGMLKASHLAGEAINISQTTAGHAMSYSITSLCGYAHGHACIICNRFLFPWTIQNIDRCTDPRGQVHLKRVLNDIGKLLGGDDALSGANRLDELFAKLNLEMPHLVSPPYDFLVNGVNETRLKNHPISLNADDISFLYHRIME